MDPSLNVSLMSHCVICLKKVEDDEEKFEFNEFGDSPSFLATFNELWRVLKVNQSEAGGGGVIGGISLTTVIKLNGEQGGGDGGGGNGSVTYFTEELPPTLCQICGEKFINVDNLMKAVRQQVREVKLLWIKSRSKIVDDGRRVKEFEMHLQDNGLDESEIQATLKFVGVSSGEGQDGGQEGPPIQVKMDPDFNKLPLVKLIKFEVNPEESSPQLASVSGFSEQSMDWDWDQDEDSTNFMENDNDNTNSESEVDNNDQSKSKNISPKKGAGQSGQQWFSSELDKKEERRRRDAERKRLYRLKLKERGYVPLTEEQKIKREEKLKRRRERERIRREAKREKKEKESLLKRKSGRKSPQKKIEAGSSLTSEQSDEKNREDEKESGEDWGAESGGGNDDRDDDDPNYSVSEQGDDDKMFEKQDKKEIGKRRGRKPKYGPMTAEERKEKLKEATKLWRQKQKEKMAEMTPQELEKFKERRKIKNEKERFRRMEERIRMKVGPLTEEERKKFEAIRERERERNRQKRAPVGYDEQGQPIYTPQQLERRRRECERLTRRAKMRREKLKRNEISLTEEQLRKEEEQKRRNAENARFKRIKKQMQGFTEEELRRHEEYNEVRKERQRRQRELEREQRGPDWKKTKERKIDKRTLAKMGHGTAEYFGDGESSTATTSESWAYGNM